MRSDVQLNFLWLCLCDHSDDISILTVRMSPFKIKKNIELDPIVCFSTKRDIFLCLSTNSSDLIKLIRPEGKIRFCCIANVVHLADVPEIHSTLVQAKMR